MRFSEETIWQVWGKGSVIGANDPVLWRMDMCGAWIYRSYYEKKDSEYGWEIAHIKPLSEGGTNKISNLIPIHCGNATRKKDGTFDCRIVARSYNNIDIQNQTPKIEF